MTRIHWVEGNPLFFKKNHGQFVQKSLFPLSHSPAEVPRGTCVNNHHCCVAQCVLLVPAGVTVSSKTHLRMLGGKAKVKQRRDTESEDGLLQPQTFHHSHRESTHLLLMSVREETV